MGIPDPVDNLGSLSGYHSPQVDVDVRLNTNESPFPPPPGFREELIAALHQIDFNRYPDRRYRSLRAAIADLHDVASDHVFVANGSNEVLQTLFLAYGGHGRTAALFEPTYAMHSQIARVTGTSLAVGRRGDDLRLDVDEVRRVVASSRPALTFVCSPNNPTGQAEPRETLDQVLELDAGLIVVDEAYGQFSPWTALGLVADDQPLVVTRTYSKTWSMAATRLGYLVGPPSVVAALDARVLPYHLDAVKQVAGEVALRFRQEMEDRVAIIADERKRLSAALDVLDVTYWPSDANFLLFRPASRSGDEVWRALVDRSVLVRNCGTWPGLADCLRVTVGTPEENDRFIAALTEVL